jgi:hypothetical protein
MILHIIINIKSNIKQKEDFHLSKYMDFDMI